MVGIIQKTIISLLKRMKIVLEVELVEEEEALKEVEEIALNVEKKVICLENVQIKTVVNINL